MPFKCKGCGRWRSLSGYGSKRERDMACHHAIDTGELRIIPAKECYENKVYFITRAQRRAEEAKMKQAELEYKKAMREKRRERHLKEENDA